MTLGEGTSNGLEQFMAERAIVSGNPAFALAPFFEFEEDLTGQKILDVCGGASDLTATLLERGADAYAFDYGYGDVESLLAAVNDIRNQKFVDSYAANPERYIQGLASNLPFSDGSIDRVVSFYGILGVLDGYRELLEASLLEAIRVTRIGGSVELGPVYSDLFGRSARVNVANILGNIDRVTLSSRIPVDPRVDSTGVKLPAKLIIRKVA